MADLQDSYDIPNSQSPDVKGMIVAAADRHGVPAEPLLAIAQQESNYNPNAYNKEYGATGLFQFIPDTARRYNIDPRDPYQSSDAAAQMFKDNLNAKNGDVNKAIAAHFAGPDESKWGPKTAKYVKDVNAKMLPDSLDIPQQQPQGLQDSYDIPTTGNLPDSFDIPEDKGLVGTILDAEQKPFAKAYEETVDKPMATIAANDRNPDGSINWGNYVSSRIDALKGLTYGAIESVPPAVIGSIEAIGNLFKLDSKMSDEEKMKVLQERPWAQTVSNWIDSQMITDPKLKDNPVFKAAQELVAAPFAFPLASTREATEAITGSKVAGQVASNLGEAVGLSLMAHGAYVKLRGEPSIGPAKKAPDEELQKVVAQGPQEPPGGGGADEPPELLDEYKEYGQGGKVKETPEGETPLPEIQPDMIDKSGMPNEDLLNKPKEETPTPPEGEPKPVTSADTAKWDEIEKQLAAEDTRKEPSINKGTFGQSGATTFFSSRGPKEMEVNTDYLTHNNRDEILYSTKSDITRAIRFIQERWPNITSKAKLYLVDSASIPVTNKLVKNVVAWRSDKGIFLNIDKIYPEQGLRGVVGTLMHEFTHELQMRGKGFNKELMPKTTEELNKTRWADRPWEQQAERNSALAQRRLPEPVPPGLQKIWKESGIIDDKIGLETGGSIPNPNIAGIPVRGRRLNKGTFGQSGGIELPSLDELRKVWEKTKEIGRNIRGKSIFDVTDQEGEISNFMSSNQKMLEDRIKGFEDSLPSVEKGLKEGTISPEQAESYKASLEKQIANTRNIINKGTFGQSGAADFFSNDKQLESVKARRDFLNKEFSDAYEKTRDPNLPPEEKKLAAERMQFLRHEIVDAAKTQDRLENPPEAIKNLKKTGKGSFGQGGAWVPGALFKDAKDHSDFQGDKEARHKLNAIVGRLDMTPEQFLAKHFKSGEQVDVRRRGGAGSGMYAYIRELSNNLNNYAHGVWSVAYVKDRMHLAREALETTIVNLIHPSTIAMRDFYKSNNPLRFDHKTFMNDVKALLSLEGGKGWFDPVLKNYSPSIEDMVKAGMSEDSAKVWSKYYDSVDKVLWPAIIQFAKDKGLHIPDRIPGWIPHFTQGRWRVRLTREYTDAKGNPVVEYLATVGARDAKTATQVKKILDRDYPGKDASIRTRIDVPTAGSNYIGAIDDLMDLKDKLTGNKGLQALIERAYEAASIGMLKSSLERKASPQMLHDLERVVKGGDLQLSRAEARKALNRMTDIMEFIPTMNMRAEFLTKTLFPLQASGYFKDIPATRKLVSEHVRQFLRIPDTANAWFDSMIADYMISKGYDPKLAERLAQQAQTFGTAWYLMLSPAFYTVQMFQKIANQGSLMTQAAQAKMLGLKAPSPLEAIIKSAAIPAKSIKLSTGESLRDYAMRVGAATPSYVENMRGNWNIVSRLIEQNTRIAGVETGYLMWRQVLSEQDALRAATKFTKDVNVDYTGDLGKPTWFSKEGVYMKPLFMFAQYSLDQWQRMFYQASVAKKALVAGNIVAASSAIQGSLYNLFWMAAMGGLLGLPLMTQLNKLAITMNQKFNTDFPTALGIGRRLGELLRQYKWSDAMSDFAARTSEFGLISQIPMLFGAHGYDVSTSARGPSLFFGQVFPSFVTSILEHATVGIRATEKIGVSSNELYQASKDMPKVARGAIEEYLRHERAPSRNTPPFSDVISGKTPEKAPMPFNIAENATYTRSRADTLLNLIGLKSLGEQAESHDIQLQTQRTKVMNDQFNRLEDQFKENPQLRRTNPEKWKMLMDLSKVQGRDVSSEINDIIKFQEIRDMTEEQRMQFGLSSIKSFKDYQRWKQVIQSNPTKNR